MSAALPERPPRRPLVLLSALPAGGAERVSVTFLRHLAARGRTVPVATLTDRRDSPLAAELQAAGVPRHDLGASRLLDPRALVRYVRLLRRERIDLVHAHGQDASILALAGRWWTGTPLVVTRHVLDEPTDALRRRWRARFALRALRRADAAIAVSHATAQRLVTLTGMPRAAVHVLPNGIDLDAFDDPLRDERAAALRRELASRPGAALILLPAVLREGKGHEDALAAWPRILDAHPGARLVLAGAGEREEELRRAARPHGDSVVFLGHRADVPDLLAACDLVLLPSRAEALPTVLIEAAAAGRAVVATRVGGTADVVDDGVTGVLVEPGDPAALAEAAVTLLGDPALRGRLGERARVRARERFSLDAFTEATLALWEEVARRTAEGGPR